MFALYIVLEVASVSNFQVLVGVDSFLEMDARTDEDSRAQGTVAVSACSKKLSAPTLATRHP